MPEILIHIGFGKTGSTLFQKNLFSNHPQINYLGGVRKDNLEAGNELRNNIYSLLRAMISSDSLQFDEKHWKAFYQQRIEPLLSDNHLNLISEEWLSMTPVSLVRGDRGLIAERLHNIFGSDALILMLIRNQADVLKSLYYNHLNIISHLYIRWASSLSHYNLSKEKFYKLLMQTEDYGLLSHYKYFEITNKYRSIFGNNLKLKLFEDFNNNQKVFLRELAEELNLDSQPFLDNLPSYKVKATVNKSNFLSRAKRYITELLLRDGGECADVFAGNYRGLKRVDSAMAYKYVEDYFMHDNEKLSNLLNVDLRQYGYKLP